MKIISKEGSPFHMKVDINGAVLSTNKYEIDEEQEFSDYDVDLPDPYWRYTDSHGHRHAWAGSELPTLVKPAYPDRCGVYHYVCTRCGDVVVPQRRSRPAPMATVLYYRYVINVVLSGWHGLSAIYEAPDASVEIEYKGQKLKGHIKTIRNDNLVHSIDIVIISEKRLKL